MSDYPKAIRLTGKMQLLDFSGTHWYRVESPEHEQAIRQRHQEQVELAKKEEERLFFEAQRMAARQACKTGTRPSNLNVLPNAVAVLPGDCQSSARSG